MIGILRNQNVRQQPRSSQAVIYWPGFRRRLHDALAARAAQLRAHLANYLESLRHILQHLRDIFTQLAKPAAAIGTDRLLRFASANLARQMLRQATPDR